VYTFIEPLAGVKARSLWNKVIRNSLGILFVLIPTQAQLYIFLAIKRSGDVLPKVKCTETQRKLRRCLCLAFNLLKFRPPPQQKQTVTITTTHFYLTLALHLRSVFCFARLILRDI